MAPRQLTLTVFLGFALTGRASVATAAQDRTIAKQSRIRNFLEGSHDTKLVEHHQGNASRASQKKIVPELDPVSSKRFFKKDYPDDLRPASTHRFSFPFPSVQDSEDYDKDFVKDENNDGGEWKAQLEYDRLRVKLRKEQEALKRLQGKKNQDDGALKDAEDEERSAEDKWKAAQDKTKASSGKAEQAQQDLDRMNQDIPQYTNKVDGAVAGLKECEEELERARARLKALTQERDAALKQRSSADSVRKDAEKSEVSAEEGVSVSKKKTAAAQEEYDAAKKNLDKHESVIASMERQMKEAENKVRKFRHESVDQDGGVYRAPEKAGSNTGFWARSAAEVRTVSTLIVTVTLVTTFAA